MFLMLTAPPAEQTKVTRRQFLKKGVVAGIGTLALGSYSVIFEPNHIVTRSLELTLPRLPEAFDGFRIAQISDIHYDEFLGEDHLNAVIDRVNSSNPHLVVITGDFVTHASASANSRTRSALKAEPCAALLRKLRSRHGTIAVLGNHDHSTNPDIVTQALSSQNVRVLRNHVTALESSGSRLWIAGVDDAVENAADLPGTMAQIPKGETASITLLHEPDMADAVRRYPVDLQLSGHSHGGQVRIPFVGAPVLPHLGRKYPLGHYNIHGLQLYTNPGIGVINLPIRFDCPPEITVLTLRSAAIRRSSLPSHG